MPGKVLNPYGSDRGVRGYESISLKCFKQAKMATLFL